MEARQGNANQGNNREIQRLNGRKVYLSHNKDFPNPNEHNDYI